MAAKFSHVVDDIHHNRLFPSLSLPNSLDRSIMGVGRFLLNVLVVLAAVAGGFYQFKLRPLLERFGHGRIIRSVGNTDCTGVPELKACEKIVLHQPTGVIYLACSTPESRVHWTPAVGHLNAEGASREDYVATYDPLTQKITRLTVTGFTSKRGLSLHGMDVVPSADDPDQLWVYLVNHRAPLEGDARKVGADSAIEVFKTIVGSSKLEYVRTVEDDTIITPNDLIGSPDGKSFYVTNDHGVKVGFSRDLEMLGRSATSVVYCHVDEGCKFAIQGMHGNNGIAQAPNGTIYVVNSLHGALNVLERQADNTLVLTDVIEVDRPMDNAMVDSEGHVWTAAFPKALTLVFKHFKDPVNVLSPSTAFRFSINTGEDAFYGKKFKVDRAFEDDGEIASGTTSAVYDAERNRLFLNGLAAPRLTICKL
ncbi:serum paraoxonase/arylesterase [Coprinopsis cinerea okayama7|uniref:Serum paraoxonase/arylesterase n=1 Tax=Coprinopsis cinerea (strain Okayama-7 / 130 / ATCC MYA-4618 / FGSC 9003) TaxID=240176 RepID=A8N7C7_COPC7|nr:serum paraoxonase/arylesterase [Coprinopsis cinerea okayama7\|eukprot:XP_001830733.2 serum paraoxonase/arylesterase [Coprinopsis cinerea okayama7\